MNHLQKWIVDNEYREIFSVLPEYMKLRTIEQYSLFLITVVVQRGFYKNKRIQFLIDVPNDYNKSPPIIVCLHKIWHACVDIKTGLVTVLIWSEYEDPNGKIVRIKNWNRDYGRLKDAIFVIEFILNTVDKCVKNPRGVRCVVPPQRIRFKKDSKYNKVYQH